MVENILLFGQFFDIKILVALHVLSSLEFKNLIFSGCIVYVTVIRIIKKKSSRNFKFRILH